MLAFGAQVIDKPNFCPVEQVRGCRQAEADIRDQVQQASAVQDLSPGDGAGIMGTSKCEL